MNSDLKSQRLSIITVTNCKMGFQIKTESIILFIVFTLIIGVFVSCKERTQLPDPLEAGWDGEKVCEVVFEDKDLRVLKCTFAPGVGHEKHYHAKYFGYALSGSTFQITDESGTREVIVASGNSFKNEGIAWHEVLNIGDSTALYLIIEPK